MILIPWIVLTAAIVFEIPIVVTILAGFYLFGLLGAVIASFAVMTAIICYFSTRSIIEVKICLVALLLDSLVNVIVAAKILPTTDLYNSQSLLAIVAFSPLAYLLTWIIFDCLTISERRPQALRYK